MSQGYWNYAAQNNSHDWDVVLAGTATLKATTVLSDGDAFHFKNHPNAPSSTQWVELVGDGTTQLSSLLPSGASLDFKLTANKTVNVPAASTSAEIQALINAEPKNLNGYTLTFQFVTGTSSISSTIMVYGFYGGLLNILGDSSDATASLTKNVIFTASGNVTLLAVQQCSASVNIRYIRFNNTTTTASFSTIQILECFTVAMNANSNDTDAGTYGRILASRNSGLSIENHYGTNLSSVAYSQLGSGVNYKSSNIEGTVTTDIISDGAIMIYDSGVVADGITYSKINGGIIYDTTGAI